MNLKKLMEAPSSFHNLFIYLCNRKENSDVLVKSLDMIKFIMRVLSF